MQDEKIDIPISKAGAVMHALHRSVAVKPELSKENLQYFISSFFPFSHMGIAFELRFLRRIEEVTLLDKVCN